MAVFDCTLYWHDGGSLFLGTVSAPTGEAAEEVAVASYSAQNKKQAREIEEGGGFQVGADLLSPGDAARWLEQEERRQAARLAARRAPGPAGPSRFGESMAEKFGLCPCGK